MSSGELLLTSLVALLNFGPKELPKLARHLGRALAQLKQFQTRLHQAQEELIQVQQLKENQIKAEQADAQYHITQISHQKSPLEVVPHE